MQSAKETFKGDAVSERVRKGVGGRRPGTGAQERVQGKQEALEMILRRLPTASSGDSRRREDADQRGGRGGGRSGRSQGRRPNPGGHPAHLFPGM